MMLMWTSSWPPGRMSVRDMGFMERLTLALTLVINISTDTVETAAPSPPYNVTLNSVTSTTALVHWRSESTTSPITHFTMNLVTLDEHQHHQDRSSMAAGYVHDVAIGSARSHLLEHLIPDTLYRMSVVAYCGESFSEASSTVTFRTTTAAVDVKHAGVQVDPSDILIVLIIIIAWICAIVLLSNKWRTIRIVLPREPRYKHSPKNLDSVKVVERSRDGIIYKHYSAGISRNMEAREVKRLQRMQTMPNIKVNELILKDTDVEIHAPTKKRSTLPNITLEEEVAELSSSNKPTTDCIDPASSSTV